MGVFLIWVPMPVGKVPWPGLVSTAFAWNGAVCTLFKATMKGRGRTSKIPPPPRTAVLPSPKGSQANPMRGSKFFIVGFDVNVTVLKPVQVEELAVPSALATHPPGFVVRSGRFAIFPLASVGI